MGGSESSIDVTTEDVASGSSFCHDDSDDSDLEGSSFADYAENNFGTGIALEECDIPSDPERDDLVAEEVGVAFANSKVLHLTDNEEFVGSCPISGPDEVFEEDFVQSISLNSNPADLAEAQTLTAALAAGPYRVASDGNAVLSSCSVMTGSCSNNATPLPSAMKGSRAQRGIILESELSVKWAPDVYDPPVTSDCHTLKGHQQRSSRKDYQKQKSSKSRSYRNKKEKPAHRSSSSSRCRTKAVDPRMLSFQAGNAKVRVGKSALPMEDHILAPVVEAKEIKCSNSSIIDPRIFRLQAGHAEMELSSSALPKVDKILAPAVKAKELKRSSSSSSFCKEQRVSSLHFSLAEAS